MLTTLGFAAGASLPLLVGAVVGVLWSPPRRLVAVALAFAAGALISAVSFELFQESYSSGGHCARDSPSRRGRPSSS